MVGLRVIERVSQVDAEAEDGPGLDDSVAVVERVATVRGHSGHHWIVTGWNVFLYIMRNVVFHFWSLIVVFFMLGMYIV